MSLIQDRVEANRLLEQHPTDGLLLIGLGNGIVLVVTPGTSPQNVATRTFGLLTYHQKTALPQKAHSWFGAMHAELEKYYKETGHTNPGWWASDYTSSVPTTDLGLGRKPILTVVVPEYTLIGADGVATVSPTATHRFVFDEPVSSVDTF